MAVTETASKVTVKMMLENGSSATGAILTVGVSLGTLKVDTYNNDKAMAIVSALSPIFTKSLYKTQKTGVSDLVSQE